MNTDTARALLDVAADCTSEELAAAFKARSRMMHPDRFSGRPESEVRMATRDYQRLEEAYRLLRSSPPPTPPTPQRGSDVLRDHMISQEVARDGGVILVDGRDGSVRVRVPANTVDATKIRLRGYGHQGSGGGDAGDLFITLRIEPERGEDRFGGQDVFREHVISSHQAEFGALVSIETDHGDIIVRVAPNTVHGSRTRLVGRGGPASAGAKNGDLIVTWLVDDPPATGSAQAPESSQGPQRSRPLRQRMGAMVLILVCSILLVTLIVAATTTARDRNRADSQSAGSGVEVETDSDFDAQILDSAPCGSDQGCWTWSVTPVEGCTGPGDVVIGLFDSATQQDPSDTRRLYFSILRPGEPRTFSLPYEDSPYDYAAVTGIDCYNL